MTYATLGLGVLAAVLTVTVAIAVVRGLGARWWAATGITGLVLVALTVVFDSAMIAADLFRYGDDTLLGVRLWLTPVEDLAWPLVAALLLPALWAWASGDPTAEAITAEDA